MSTPTPSLAGAPNAAPRQSSLARLFGTFASPGGTFADIAREPHFILCWCVQIAVGFAYWEMLLRRMGAYALARQAILQSGRASAMDPATLQTAVQTSAKIYPYIVYLTPVSTIALLLLLGWVFQGISNFLLGYEARYKQTLALVSHAYLTQTLYALIAMLVLGLMPDPTSFQFANPIGTNPGFFLDRSSTPAFLYAVAGRFDLFSLWTVVLLALGLAQLSGRKGKFATAFWAVLGLWLFYILCVAGVSAAF